jgi:hypothetical protein
MGLYIIQGMLFGQKCPKMHVFCISKNNLLKNYGAIVHDFWPKMPENGYFFLHKQKLFKRRVNMTQNRLKPWAIVMQKCVQIYRLQ